MLATYAHFVSIYGDIMDPVEFNRLGYDASKTVEYNTTGVDGVNKLELFFPEKESDVEAVVRCVCALAKSLHEIEQAEKASGFVARADGTMTGRMVSSISSGTESMSFSGGGSAYIDAAKSAEGKAQLISGVISNYLVNACDRNGVRLLYMGAYPYVSKNNYSL